MSKRSFNSHSGDTHSGDTHSGRAHSRVLRVFGFAIAATIVLTVALWVPTTGAGAAIPAATYTYRFDETVTVPSVQGTGHSSAGNLSLALDPATGSFTGQVNRPSITIYGTALGLVPLSAVVSFSQVGALTGAVASDGSLTADLMIDIHVESISLLWILPLLNSTTCHTAAPVPLHVTAPPGGFSVIGGGTVSSTFSVGELTDCGVQTSLLNTVIPGPGNQVTLKLSPIS